MPSTMPVPEMVATEGWLLDHEPVPPVLASRVVPPSHRSVLPEMVPASGNGFTTTGYLVTAVPHRLVTL